MNNVHFVFRWMGFANCAINPFVYAFRNETFRTEATEIIYSICFCKNYKRKQYQVQVRRTWLQEDFERRSTMFSSLKKTQFQL